MHWPCQVEPRSWSLAAGLARPQIGTEIKSIRAECWQDGIVGPSGGPIVLALALWAQGWRAFSANWTHINLPSSSSSSSSSSKSGQTLAPPPTFARCNNTNVCNLN